MPKFHVSSNGMAALCTAEKVACPLTEADGSLTPHGEFPDAKAAASFAEEVTAQRYGGTFGQATATRAVATTETPKVEKKGLFSRIKARLEDPASAAKRQHLAAVIERNTGVQRPLGNTRPATSAQTANAVKPVSELASRGIKRLPQGGISGYGSERLVGEGLRNYIFRQQDAYTNGAMEYNPQGIDPVANWKVEAARLGIPAARPDVPMRKSLYNV